VSGEAARAPSSCSSTVPRATPSRTTKGKEIFLQLSAITPRNAEVFKTCSTSCPRTARSRPSGLVFAEIRRAQARRRRAAEDLGDMPMSSRIPRCRSWHIAPRSLPTLRSKILQTYVELVLSQGNPDELVKALTGANKRAGSGRGHVRFARSVYQEARQLRQGHRHVSEIHSA